MSDLLNAIERLGGWFRNDAVPLWARAGWDAKNGGFFEALDFDGRPVRGNRRVRVQSRQVYAFSMIGKHGWLDDADAIASKGFDFLVEKACPDEAQRGCVHILRDDGAVIDDRRDLYDQAFLLLACAGRITAANCAHAKSVANATAEFLDRELASPHGGWFESDKKELPRRQNPHMHLFEAFMALFEATGDAYWGEKAKAVLVLFDLHFFNESTGRLSEIFSEDWAKSHDVRAVAMEPGHMMEWVWLLTRFEALENGQSQTASKEALYGSASDFADTKPGFLPDAVGSDADIENRRLWPQTEFLRAALSMSTNLADDYAMTAANIINALFETYLDQPITGLWCDQYDGAGAPIAKDVPASIVYHLYEAVAEADRYAKKVTP